MTVRGKEKQVTLLFLVGCFFMGSCVSFREKPKVITSYFAAHNVEGTIATFQSGKRKIYYAQSGNSSKPVVVFVHGSPGSLSAFVPFLVDSILLEKAHLVTVDRPGFGYSHYGQGEKSLAVQAALIRDLVMQKSNGQPLILVGHSLGGPLVAKVAMDYPDIVDGVVVVSGSIDPDLEPNEMWFRAPLATPFLRWLLPGSLRASNHELYHLKPELERMVSDWRKIRCPVVIVHGKRDKLVPFENVAFAEKHLDPEIARYITHENAGHFIPWQQPEMITEGILYLLEKFSHDRPSHRGSMTAVSDSTGFVDDLR